MEDQFVLKTTAHWKALSHPLRSSILRILSDEGLTNEELAERLGVEGGNLHFHTRQLLEAGLIQVVETRTKGSILEKVYRAVARSFVAHTLPDAEEVGLSNPPFDALLGGGLALYRQAWRDHGESGLHPHLAYHITNRVPPERIQEFAAAVNALAALFGDIRTEDPDSPEYSFAILLHAMPPTVPRRK